MKILITGGHPAPALALIDELKQYKNVQMVFVGRKHPLINEKNYSFEYQEIKKRGIRFIDLKTGKLVRYFAKDFFINLFLLFRGFFASLKVLMIEKPDLVFSFGGYLGFPIAFWAWVFRVPIVIHEQTVAPGLANRIIGFFAKKVLLAFPQAKGFFNEKKTMVVGNPIRFSKIYPFAPPIIGGATVYTQRSFKRSGIDIYQKVIKSKQSDIKIKEKNITDRPIIYITGGSLGSHTINTHIEKILPFLLKKYTIIHQVGNISQFDDFTRLKQKFNHQNYQIFTHIDQKELKDIYEKSDLVVGRAGANTFFELIAFQKPALFIPLPFSASSEQKKHALIFYESGAGEIFDQEDDSFKLLKLIDKMIDNLAFYKKNLEKLKYLYQKDATKKIISVIFSSVKKD
jgi:UDP-N-acetylglucosamine--N-acetylmuramyl-(pentapeptide) pyrophosphoryl-undecaprenol N-acetylglucosamine transferase